MNAMWLLKFLSVATADTTAAVSGSSGMDWRNPLTISASPISPPVEPDEVEVTGLWLDSNPLEPRLSEEEEGPRLRWDFFFRPLPFGWLRLGETTWSWDACLVCCSQSALAILFGADLSEELPLLRLRTETV